MIRTILALSTGAVLLAACAADPNQAARHDDDAYVPIGSNIPRKGKAPESTAATLPPGAYVPSPGVPRAN